MDFKVGDIIKGKKENGDCYINERMLKAEVVTSDNITMEIKILEHADPKYINKTWFTWNDKNLFDYAQEKDCIVIYRIEDYITAVMYKTTGEKKYIEYCCEKDNTSFEKCAKDVLERLIHETTKFDDAADWFKEELKEGKCSENCVQCNMNEIALQAIEKQIPKKVISEEQYCGKCPSCGAIFLNKDLPFCGNCGQAIDWNKEE